MSSPADLWSELHRPGLTAHERTDLLQRYNLDVLYMESPMALASKRSRREAISREAFHALSEVAVGMDCADSTGLYNKTKMHSTTNYSVLAIFTVNNKLCTAMHEKYREETGFTKPDDVTTVFHGTPASRLYPITQTGLRGAAVSRKMYGTGVNTTKDFRNAVAYSTPDLYKNQYVLLCDMVCGRTFAEGRQDLVYFGKDDRGHDKITSSSPDGDVLVASHDSQLRIKQVGFPHFLPALCFYLEYFLACFYRTGCCCAAPLFYPELGPDYSRTSLQ